MFWIVLICWTFLEWSSKSIPNWRLPGYQLHVALHVALFCKWISPGGASKPRPAPISRAASRCQWPDRPKKDAGSDHAKPWEYHRTEWNTNISIKVKKFRSFMIIYDHSQICWLLRCSNVYQLVWCELREGVPEGFATWKWIPTHEFPSKTWLMWALFVLKLLFFLHIQNWRCHSDGARSNHTLSQELTAGSKRGGGGRTEQKNPGNSTKNIPILAQIHCEAMECERHSVVHWNSNPPLRLCFF